MLAILIIILVLLWAAVVWSIYSNFLVFYSNFSESENYHRAYYASISALERWELVTKQRIPWYEWSWGFKWWIWTWSFIWSDKNLSWFSYLSGDKNESSVLWTINSRTSRIPATWKWNVERMLAYNNIADPEDPENSNNYNMMDYENAEIFLLYYDYSNGNPYSLTEIIEKPPFNNQISWKIRLPKLLLNSWFWYLDTNNPSIWVRGSVPNDDAIVDRQIRWKYGYDYQPFTIFSTSNISIWWDGFSLGSWDSVIRESDINSGWNFTFWSKRSPISRTRTPSVTIISEKENEIRDLRDFSTLFLNTTQTQLRFSLLNLLWTWTKVYPFLEYYIDFWSNLVSDKYFTINGEWSYKVYQVNKIILKPTIKVSVLWNFTSIF